MKLLLLLICVVFLPCLSVAQDYRGENKVFFKFEKKDKSFYIYESGSLTLEVDRELNTFVFVVDIDTFVPVDSVDVKGLWDTFSSKAFHNDVSYKGEIALMGLDLQSDRKQLVDVNGILHMGDTELELPLKLEWSQMDRFVFVDFNYILSLKEVGVIVPEKYQNQLTGNLYIEVLNAKLVGGFK